MKYSQPSSDEVDRMKEEHQQEKDNLRMLELIVEYHINNPDLNRQREIVRRIKDRIILSEAYFSYPLLKSYVCEFPTSEYCERKIDHSFRDWVTYGNCCKVCNQLLSRAVQLTPETQTQSIRSTAWDELAKLDEMLTTS